ncbi:MAG TPA: alanine racemase [Ilumatobacter sp.]|nr:alanine racemase [Ilumatobacter sp.]
MSGNGDAALRWAWVEIDLGAIEHNVRLLQHRIAPSALWAVVKADGYGHGAVRVAERALSAGASGLCVALASEGAELREAGIDAPILVFGQQPPDHLPLMREQRLIATAFTSEYIAALNDVASSHGADRWPVHVNVDTGMQRVGVSWRNSVDPVALVAAASHLELAGVYTHFACADDPSSPATAAQLARFDAMLGELDRKQLRPPVVHAANSAAAVSAPTSRLSFVRAGIATYGISPGAGVDHLVADLRPAMSFKARVSHVKTVEAGSFISYGWRHQFDRRTNVITVPCGYADGVPRRLGTLPDAPGAAVLVGGQRRPIVGVVTMDQFMVDVGDDIVAVGDEVVLIGSQANETVLATDWADRLGTIGYEIVCGVSRRIPRIAVG